MPTLSSAKHDRVAQLGGRHRKPVTPKSHRLRHEVDGKRAAFDPASCAATPRSPQGWKLE